MTGGQTMPWKSERQFSVQSDLKCADVTAGTFWEPSSVSGLTWFCRYLINKVCIKVACRKNTPQQWGLSILMFYCIELHIQCIITCMDTHRKCWHKNLHILVRQPRTETNHEKVSVFNRAMTSSQTQTQSVKCYKTHVIFFSFLGEMYNTTSIHPQTHVVDPLLNTSAKKSLSDKKSL